MYDTATPTLFLVRPDNYIGCATHDPADVLTYLRRLGSAQRRCPLGIVECNRLKYGSQRPRAGG